jgi:hypothetical protein
VGIPRSRLFPSLLPALLRLLRSHSEGLRLVEHRPDFTTNNPSGGFCLPLTMKLTGGTQRPATRPSCLPFALSGGLGAGAVSLMAAQEG